MIQCDAYSDWQKLCEEHEAARDENFQEFSAINRKLSATRNSTPQINPPEYDLLEFDRTWRKLDYIKIRMNEFVKNYSNTNK